MRSAGGNDQHVAFRDRNVLGANGCRAAASFSVFDADGPPLPIGDRAAHLHGPFARDHVVDLRYVVMDCIVLIFPVLGPQHHAYPDLSVVRGSTHFHHGHRDIGLFGRKHALLVRLDLRGADHGRWEIVAVTGQSQGRRIGCGLRLCAYDNTQAKRNRQQSAKRRFAVPECSIHVCPLYP